MQPHSRSEETTMSAASSLASEVEEEEAGSTDDPGSPESIKSPPTTPASSQKSSRTRLLCKPDSLFHELKSCRHVVATEVPERCAANCRGNRYSDVQVEGSFECPVCAKENLQLYLSYKRESFAKNLRILAMVSGLGADWLSLRLEKMEVTWKNEHLRDKEDARSTTLRACSAADDQWLTLIAQTEQICTPASSLGSVIEDEAQQTSGSDVRSPKLKSGIPPRKARPASKLPTRPRSTAA